MKLLKVLVTSRKRASYILCVFTNPVSIGNKFNNLGRNFDMSDKQRSKNIFMDPEMGRVCHLVVLKGIFVTIVRAVLLFKIRFSWGKMCGKDCHYRKHHLKAI